MSLGYAAAQGYTGSPIDPQPQLQDVITLPTSYLSAGGYSGYQPTPVSSLAAPAKTSWWDSILKPWTQPFEGTSVVKTVTETSVMLRDALLKKYVFKDEVEEGTGNKYPTPAAPPAPTTPISSIPERIVYAITGEKPAQLISAPAAATAIGGVGIVIAGVLIFLILRGGNK